MSGGNDEKQGHLYKVLVIGDYAVGKTSLIRRYTEGFFTPNYKLTIGVDFAVKEIEWDADTTISLQLWDVAGHERFGTMTRVYYRYAIAAIIVFDVSRVGTFDAVSKWRDDINSKGPIPMLLLANKCDLPDAVVDNARLDAYCAANGFIGWYATSAQDNINVDEAMKFLVAKILDVSQRVKVDRPGPAPQHNSNAVSVVSHKSFDGGSQQFASTPPKEKDGCDC